MPRRCIPIRHLGPDGSVVTGIATVFERDRRCSSCGGGRATLQCDYPVIPRKGRAGTCDRWLCSTCAAEVGPNRHYCPPHERASRLPGVE